MFHEYGGENVAVTNFISRFSMFIPTKANFKLANEKTGHAQGIGIILCSFTNWTILCTVVPVYYFPDHPSNTISLSTLKFYGGFHKVTSETLKHFDFVHPQGHSWI